MTINAKFNPENYHALIFDLDGTLIDSMPLHNKAWMDTLVDNGVEITEAFLQETAGMASTRIVSIVNDRFQMKLDPESVSMQKRQKYLATLDQVIVVDELMKIIDKYYKKVPLAIITGGSHEVVDQLLPKLKIDHYFDKVVCSDDTKLGKDSVEPYELACSAMNVSPKKCLFFDDGDVGLKGAKLAGLDVVHVDLNHPDIFLSVFVH